MSASHGAPAVQRLTLTAADGYTLTAHRFSPAGPARANLVMAGATAVPQKFYRRFAEFARQQGYDTLTLDYRGIGQSAPKSLRGFRMDYLDWGRLDLAAAVNLMHDPSRPLFMVGHSYGGHALGVLPNHQLLDAFYVFGTGSGWHGWMPPLERLRIVLLWNLVGPLVTRWKGYLPFKRMGMGENLPLDVYRQWKRWCSYPHYFFDDPARPELHEAFAQVRMPIVAANSLDDAWASPRSRDAFMQGYRNADWQAHTIQPDAHTGPIGHMGYFRPSSQRLWQEALDWFAQRKVMSAPPASAAIPPVVALLA